MLMGAKDSILEFAREPAGGGCGREWCFPVQCMVVARLPGCIPRGNAAHAACEMLPSALERTHLSSYSRASLSAPTGP